MVHRCSAPALRARLEPRDQWFGQRPQLIRHQAPRKSVHHNMITSQVQIHVRHALSPPIDDRSRASEKARVALRRLLALPMWLPAAEMARTAVEHAPDTLRKSVPPALIT